jgi:putative ABC transport system permease protein
VSDTYISLTYWQVVAATFLLLINGAISVAFNLGMQRQLAVAAVRTVVQLSLVGLVLQKVFSYAYVPVVLGAIVVMTVIAGLSAVQRVELPYAGIRWDCLCTMAGSAWTLGAVTLLAIIQCEPWYAPQYAIPLVGMILGNTLSGISLGLDRLTKDLYQQRELVEGLLALGATRWEASLPSVQQAVRTGMVPMINSMMIVGVVSLPGMMTGQILAGQDPSEAVKYQIVIMFVIASATALGTVMAVLLAYRRLFDVHHRFRGDQLRTPVK